MPCNLANRRCDNKVKSHWLSCYDLCSVTLFNVERSHVEGSIMTFHSFTALHTILREVNANPKNASAATIHLKSQSSSVQSSHEDNQEHLI